MGGGSGALDLKKNQYIQKPANRERTKMSRVDSQPSSAAASTMVSAAWSMILATVSQMLAQ